MCRHLAYLGPPVPLARLLYDPPHALVRQAWAPRDMRGGGTINADGFGVGWFPEGGGAAPNGSGPGGQGPAGAGYGGPAVRYRRGCPMWADTGLPGLAAVTRSPAVLAAVRSATEGMPVVDTAAAPFTDGRWLFSHNGAVQGWPETVGPIAVRLPVRDLLTLDAPTDAALLWALVRARLRAGCGPAEAISETVVEVSEAAPGSRLNLLLVGAGTAVATTYGHALSMLVRGDATLLASEPLDGEPGWRPVPEGHLLVATATAVHLSKLPGRPPTGVPAASRERTVTEETS
jgi:glutamine amidotransferase